MLLAGCGDGGTGSGGSGGVGGDGGAGGATTTTTANPLTVCPVQAETHVVAIVVGPDGMALGPKPVNVTGTVVDAGVDTPPTFECGAGMAWVTISSDAGGSQWTACFQAPSLQWNVTAGDAATLRQTVIEHPIAPATVHTTLRDNDALVVHVEVAMNEEEISLPDGLQLARSEQVCASPNDPCNLEGYAVTVLNGNGSVEIQPGETGILEAFNVYIDRYWIQHVSSACDGGGADIRASVTPVPPP